MNNEENAYQKGYEAYGDGLSIYENPYLYERDKDNYLAWRNGWIDANENITYDPLDE